MKVLVYYEPGHKRDVFEGMRLRKNIKGALELAAIEWVAAATHPDIAHFLSPLDLKKAIKAKKEGAKIVVSAFYTESDPFCSYCEEKNKQSVLTKKANKMLALADLILVPTENDKKTLLTLGHNENKISVATPGINPARFEELSPLESGIFRSYMRLKSEEKIAILLADYGDQWALKKIKTLAEGAPSVRFFVFGLPKSGPKTIRLLNRKRPQNLLFCNLVEDDVYRSALYHAACFVIFEREHDDYLPCLEAMASKTQIFYIGTPKENGILVPNENCLAFTTIGTAASAIEDYCRTGDKATIIKARKTASDHTLEALGKQLKQDYENALNKEANL